MSLVAWGRRFASPVFTLSHRCHICLRVTLKTTLTVRRLPTCLITTARSATTDYTTDKYEWIQAGCYSSQPFTAASVPPNPAADNGTFTRANTSEQPKAWAYDNSGRGPLQCRLHGAPQWRPPATMPGADDSTEIGASHALVTFVNTMGNTGNNGTTLISG